MNAVACSRALQPPLMPCLVASPPCGALQFLSALRLCGVVRFLAALRAACGAICYLHGLRLLSGLPRVRSSLQTTKLPRQVGPLSEARKKKQTAKLPRQVGPPSEARKDYKQPSFPGRWDRHQKRDKITNSQASQAGGTAIRSAKRLQTAKLPKQVRPPSEARKDYKQPSFPGRWDRHQKREKNTNSQASQAGGTAIRSAKKYKFGAGSNICFSEGGL